MLPSMMRSVVTVPAVLLSGAVALPASPAPQLLPRRLPSLRSASTGTTSRSARTVDVTIQFDLAPSFEPLDEDYRVFLHVLDDRESFLWADDHDPPAPTSTWRPGQSIQYTRRVRDTSVSVLRTGSDRGRPLLAASQGRDCRCWATTWAISPTGSATVVLEPPHERSLLAYESGWFPVEFNRTRQTGWRWTDRAGGALLAEPAPRRQAAPRRPGKSQMARPPATARARSRRPYAPRGHAAARTVTSISTTS